MGCLLGFGVQFSGVNAYMYYGNTIFRDLEMQSNYILAIIGVWTLVSLACCFLMLFYFGRKRLMVSGYFGLVVS